MKCVSQAVQETQHTNGTKCSHRMRLKFKLNITHVKHSGEKVMVWGELLRQVELGGKMDRA